MIKKTRTARGIRKLENENGEEERKIEIGVLFHEF